MHNSTGQAPGGRLRRRAKWSSWLRGAWRGAPVVIVLGAVGCSLDSLLNSDQLPPNVSDPALSQTPQGARSAYAGTLSQFGRMFGAASDGATVSFVAATGVLSDELMAHPTFSNGGGPIQLDQRLEGGQQTPYADLQKMRGQAAQAIGLLTDYLPEEPALRGHLYALQGYTELFLAELFCSGIPLSTLDYKGDYTYRPGSSADEVFAHAVALFDAALTLASDSARFVPFAQVGRARALLAVGHYADAAAGAAAVPDGYRYHVNYSSATIVTGTSWRNFASGSDGWVFTVPDGEGRHGMDWRTSGDSRTPVTPFGSAYHPDKYDTLGTSPIVLASGVEARLIEAEAALQMRSGTWLTTLNALRTDGTFETTATMPPDTLWHAGTGGVDSLAPLEDPGASLTDPTLADSVRVDLLFRERAFWLYLTGHRQGDLRRLIRQYGRLESDVYPTGVYPLGGFYGVNVTLPVPASEALNPLFTGCFSRGA